MNNTLPPITRAIPELVRRRGLSAIRDWLTTDRPHLETWGCESHGLQVKNGRPNVVGFWRKGQRGGFASFRPLITCRPGAFGHRTTQPEK